MLAAALTTVCGCGSDSADDLPEVTPAPVPTASFTEAERPTWTVDWTWHDATPDWKNPEPTRFECRMYVVLKLDQTFQENSSDGDLMAIFLGDECRGVGMRNVQRAGGAVYFPIIVHGDSEISDSKTVVQYYCDSLKHIFFFPAFHNFMPDLTIGTDYDQELIFPGTNSKYTRRRVTVTLPDSLPFTRNDRDLVGAFVDNECRGVASVGKELVVYTLLGEQDTVSFRYYSVDKGGIFRLKDGLRQQLQCRVIKKHRG